LNAIAKRFHAILDFSELDEELLIQHGRVRGIAERGVLHCGGSGGISGDAPAQRRYLAGDGRARQQRVCGIERRHEAGGVFFERRSRDFHAGAVAALCRQQRLEDVRAHRIVHHVAVHLVALRRAVGHQITGGDAGTTERNLAGHRHAKNSYGAKESDSAQARPNRS
jgi:hypothetical protein